MYDGELQVRGLGLDVHIYNDDGKEVFQEQGELICAKPFPSMPLHFWNDSDGAKYFGACTSSCVCFELCRHTANAHR